MRHLALLSIALFALIILQVSALIQSPPLIYKQPPANELLFQVAQSTANENDRPCVIECEATGEPDPRYHWRKNGKSFQWQTHDNRISQQPGRGTLVIAQPRDEDLGQYQCIAVNEWGTAISNSVFVRKAELNSFKDENPITLSASEGDPFKLTCQPPDGWPKPNVYWLIQNTDGGVKSINNSRMTVDPEGNLWFSNVTRNDASNDYYYACAATSVFRNEYKLGNRVLLNVISTGALASENKHEPVKQYVSRKNEVALRGEKIKLYCIFGGTPLPQIVWSKNGEYLHPSDRITQGNYGKSLVIKHVSFEDEGQYTCEASNGVGDAKSYSINLQVLAVPFFTVEPEIINAAENETVEFRCEANGVPQPQIKWIHNGKPIEEALPNPRRKVNTNSIVIEQLVKNDTGNYGCNATNSLGYVYKDVYVNVLALPPEIEQTPTNEATVNGRTIRITCRVFGVPKPEVKWIRNGRELTGGRYTTLESGDLEIERVNFLDAGDYTCHASNKFGSVQASGSLVVKERTTIINEPEDYEVAAGSTATFRCNAITDSSLTLIIQWLSNGELIDYELEPRFTQSADYSLTIFNTKELDSGTYTCVARTELDETKAQATLTVQDVPNPPHLVGVTCMNGVTVVSWLPVGDNRAPILRYIVQFNTSFTPDKWENAADDIPPTDWTYNVHMPPWSNYTFRVLARNKIGLSLPSQHSEVCTTQPDVLYKNPENVQGKGTDPQNIVISWTPMPQTEHNAPGFKYRVFYRRDIPGAEWITQDITDWEQHKLQVDNQPTYQRYNIKIVALNDFGESRVPPSEVIGYSGEGVPLEAPMNFTVVEIIGSTTAMFSWNPVSDESINGNFRGYKIQTWTDENFGDVQEINVGKDITETIVSRFVPFRINYVRILAYNDRYYGPASETLNIEMPEGVPGTVQSLDGFPMGSNALYLVWEKPAQPNGIITGYKIHYRVVERTELGPLVERKPQLSDPHATRVKLAGLQPSTKYRVHIRAMTKVGEGEDYFIERITRSAISVTPEVPNFTWESVPTDSDRATIKVTWLPSQDGNPGSHFFVKYKLKGEMISQQTLPEFYEDSTEVRGLTKGQVYEISIVAVDGEYLAESQPQEVNTGSEGPDVHQNKTATETE